MSSRVDRPLRCDGRARSVSRPGDRRDVVAMFSSLGRAASARAAGMRTRPSGGGSGMVAGLQGPGLVPTGCP